MGEVISLFSGNDMVYQCECGCCDFWIKGSDDFSCFQGLICQGCNALYEFRESVNREDILLYYAEE